MDEQRVLSTKEKALRMNLDKRVYGAFAEIGAGQDTAANFFKAGGASGTVAKTMSAYDMKFSDAIYGKVGRYVCEERLMTMVEREYKLLELRLSERAPKTNFFAFANTVEIINFKKTNQGHGWLGCRFQLSPKTKPNNCVIHVVLHDKGPIRQQQAIGIAGVNLLYGCFYNYDNPDEFLNSLLDNLTTDRVEVDMFSLEGPDFEHVDNRLMALKLVKSGLTSATMFGADGTVLQPSEVLYKKSVLLLRGRFRPVTNVYRDMVNTALEQFKTYPDVNEDKLIVLSELTLNALSSSGEEIDDKDFLDRVDILCNLGQTVMISNFREYYRLAGFLSHVTRTEHIGIILGVFTLAKIFQEKYYEHLDGGLLRAFGNLCGNNVTLMSYPSIDRNTKKLTNITNLKLPEKSYHLFKYLIENGKLKDIEGADESVMQILSDNVLGMIKQGQPGWEKMVPKKVAEMIIDNCLFDYPCSIEERSKRKASLLENKL